MWAVWAENAETTVMLQDVSFMMRSKHDKGTPFNQKAVAGCSENRFS